MWVLKAVVPCCSARTSGLDLMRNGNSLRVGQLQRIGYMWVTCSIARFLRVWRRCQLITDLMWVLTGDQVQLGELIWRSITRSTNHLRPLLASLVSSAGCDWAQRIVFKQYYSQLPVTLSDLNGKSNAYFRGACVS